MHPPHTSNKNNVRPTQIVILGGSGDLAKRKLIPALIDLYTHNKLPETFSIIGLARTPRTNTQYRQFISDALSKHNHNHSQKTIQDFCKHFTYIAGSFEDKESYISLKEHLEQFDKEYNVCTNKLFYLAVPPAYYKTIFTYIHDTSLATACDETSWARILVEKPFGSDLTTAQELDELLGTLFLEEQIFRIDHYLAKESVQNILSFRFANTLLKSPWNNTHIESVHIIMRESIDIQGRGTFYDNVGALRDVGQNHLLQLLALIAMDEPTSFTAKEIREKRAEVLQHLLPITKETVKHTVQRAQYEGYKNESGVSKETNTETFFHFIAHLNLPQWKGVPFHIEAGKALSERKVQIDIQFKDVASGPFETHSCHTKGNRVTLTLSPEQSMAITINSKKPGHGYQLESQTLAFTCRKDKDNEIDAYEKVLLDCILGDQTLFTTTQEVLASWSFITSILQNWDNVPLHIYKKGSNCPIKLQNNQKYYE